MKIPLSQPDITDVEIDAVTAVLRSTQLSLGPKMEEFEQRVANYIGVPHAIAVSSGTAGLHLAIRALGIGPGDEVIVPAFTFIAAANCIRYEAATPVFVDIEPTTLNMDPACIEAAITPRTRAILVVHTFGVPADLDTILDIARRHQLFVIEDACEAIGAEYDGKKVGSFGDVAVFAFYPNKQITTGEGAMVVTRDEKLGSVIRAMRNQGRYPSDAWHQHSVLGYNYRLSEINCALGCAQMSRIDAILAKREIAAQTYAAALGHLPNLLIPGSSTELKKISWFVYVIRLNDTELHRDHVIQQLEIAEIQCGRYFAPIHQQPAYAEFTPVNALRVTESESLRTIALPFFTNISLEQITHVAQQLKSLLT
jgi:perosamine synthetase